VADSQRDKMEENIESLNNLEENLNYYGKTIKTLPLVIQYNKRDLQDIMSIAESNQILNPEGYPSTEAIATSGEGVLETLTLITKMVLQHIEKGASPQQQKFQAGFQAARPEIAEPVKESHPAATEKSNKMESDAVKAGKTIPEDLTDQSPEAQAPSSAAFSGGRIRIISTGTPGIISANAFSIPIKLKFENDDKIYTMDMAIKLDKIIPEG